MNTMVETQGIKNFVRYVFDRINRDDKGILDLSCNESDYYHELGEEIISFGNSHKLFMQAVLGKLSINQVMNLMGVSEREVFRLFRLQRKQFISFIQEAEIRLYSKYPITFGNEREDG